jgi:hypothetical protein
VAAAVFEIELPPGPLAEALEAYERCPVSVL